MNNHEDNQNRNINPRNNYNENIHGNYIDNSQHIHESSSDKPFQPIKYIPKIRNPNFVGRQEKLGEIHHELNAENNNRVAISAVSGMGGVGKSELALEYAWEYIDDYSGGICWLNVRDRNLATEIIQFIQLQMDLEVPQKIQGNTLTLEQQVEWCWKNWQPPSGSVLVIFDDVTEYQDINKLLPRINNQRFKLLITTRRLGLDTKIVDIPLDVLSEDDALLLLRKILGEENTRIEDELQTAKDLCQWLGCLPLGLELVGRYLVEDADLSIAEILEELQSERLEYEALNVSELESTEMTARLGVSAAFNLTWEKLDSKTKEVGELLSLFAPDTIAWKYVESVSESLNWKKTDVRNAKKQLNGRNVIKRLEKSEASYQIHPLIREFLQTKLQASPQINELKQAFSITFIEIGKTIPLESTLEVINSVKNAIPHLTEVVENQLYTVSDENLYSAFDGLGRFYRGQGLYVSAEPWYQQCLSAVKSRLGENHPDTASSLHYLALLYWKMGRYDEAEPLHKQALELRKQLLGENHPDTANTLDNLAGLYWKMGRYEEAEPLHKQALELKKQLLGENHPDTASSLNNLGLLYRDMGRYDEAEPMYKQALDLRTQLQGVNHPHTAQSLNNLANLYLNIGRYEEAEPLHKQALELRKQLLGENHPDTASSLNNLAILYLYMGKYDEAEPIYKQALELRKQLLGENHPETAQSLNNLANLYSNMGRYDEAEPIYKQALELKKQLQGVNHPRTASTLSNLAILYYNMGRYEEAEPIYMQALELRKQLLGENHPETADSLNGLAKLYRDTGRYDEAEPLFIQAVEIVERVFGENHPDTVKYRINLADFRGK